MSEPSKEEHERWMRRAITEAERPGWRTHPNPMVGAVVVKNGVCIGTGHHAFAGAAHAEVDAITRCSEDPKGATMYVTLEPCNHIGRTGPCTKAIIDAGIARCVVAGVDPDPRVSGAGIKALREAGVQVDVGVLAADAESINRPYFTRVRGHRPWITLKLAATLDGRIATQGGQSQWITGAKARKYVHKLRARHDGLLVGTQTLLLDNPSLTARALDGSLEDSQPLRIVLDRRLASQPDAKCFAPQGRCILFTSSANQDHASKTYEHATVYGVEVNEEGHLDLREVLRVLAHKEEITTLLCEGGGELAFSLLRAGFVDELHYFVAPKILGGRSSRGSFGGAAPNSLDEATELEILDVSRVGDDILVRARPRPLGEV